MEKEKPTPSKEDIAKYNQELKNLTHQAPKFILKPFIYQEKCFALIDEGVKRNIITYEYAELKKAELQYKLNTPSRAKEFIRQKLLKAKKKFFKSKKDNKNNNNINQENIIKDIIK